ncbi:hypothetical protein D3C81_1881220 [compost metagenome]
MVGIAPVVDPADHGVLILGQIAQYAEVVLHHEEQGVVLIGRAHPPEKFADMRLAKAPRLLPQIGFTFVPRGIADVHRRQ